MARVRRVANVYPSIAEADKGGVHPILNDPDINPHVDNTEAMLRRQEHVGRKSIRDGQSEPKGAGTFEPSGPNTHYRPASDSLPPPTAN